MPETPVQEALPIEEEPWRVIGEALDTYILVEQGESLLFIDKHAAHERILFEKLRKQSAPVMSQTLLAPIPAGLTREEASAASASRTSVTAPSSYAACPATWTPRMPKPPSPS